MRSPPPPDHAGATLKRALRRGAAVLAGTAAALAALELLLRLLVTIQQPPAPAIGRDALDAPVVESRQIDEGIGDARYTVAGARLTGHAPIRGEGVATIVLLGDSYVAAREVPDSVTMGARLEERARASGARVNVRQYGWRGASAARYLLVADDVLARWDPARVVVLLSRDDLDERAASRFPRLHVRPDGSVRVLRAPPTPPPSGFLTRHSVLAMLVRHRTTLLADRAPEPVRRLAGSGAPEPLVSDSAQLAALPRAVVRALRERYDARLALVWVADAVPAPDDHERRLLEECAAQRVACASTRDSMAAAAAHGEIPRGFPTTSPGVGHLNAVGHRVLANVIRALIANDLRALPRLAGR